ncbi:hypothetical protein [Sanyastnella coralliicola]|uniref:hypothetical protein n=1 Tax=Sanyastnella coralliicola TaxID=3069118 RepID=UPI0027BB0DDC|nr:hypothetical protein [Longitalea sp. SCSIO 12813]
MHRSIENILFRKIQIVQCDLNEEGGWRMRIGIFKLRKNEVEQAEDWSDWSDLSTLEINKQQACVLQFVGRSILQKVGSKLQSTAANKDLIQKEVSVLNTKYSTIIRSKELTTLINKLAKEKWNVAAHSFGAINALRLQTALGTSAAFPLEGSSIDLSNGEVIEQPGSKPFDVWGENEAAYFYSLARGNQANKNLREESAFQLLFRKTLLIGVFGLLGILLINFLVFQQLQEKNTQLSASNQVLLDQQNELTKINAANEKKQVFLSTYAPAREISTTELLDQLGASVPAQITLNVLDVNPIELPDREGQMFQVAQGEILVKGQGDQSALNNWVQHLSGMDMISQVRILEFTNGSYAEREFKLSVRY